MADEYLPKVHIVFMYLSKANISNPMTGEKSGREFDEVLSKWVEKGYHITHVVHTDTNVEGHGLVVVLERD